MIDLSKELPLVFKTGKVIYGYREVLNSIYHSRILGVIVASKIPLEIFKRIVYNCKLANVPYYVFEGTSKELGKLCNKPFVITSIAIINQGESNILEIFKHE